LRRIALYTNCPTCEGHGRVADRHDGPRTELCPECRGTGLVATEDGKAIIGLVRAAGAEDMLPESEA
jgi:DnaJ-class molecular chaperone